MTRTLTAASAVVALLLCTTAWAHPGHVHDDEPVSRSLRTWADSTGFFQLEATYVMAKDGKVQLRKKDDSLVTFSIDRLSKEDRSWIEKRTAELHTLNTQVQRVAVALAAAKVAKPKSNANDAPSIRKHFEPFADKLKFRWDDEHFFVESNGMPDHPMMIGITAWQQQLPLPQSYTGDNAWRIPLHPVPAKQPISAKTHFFRGAIALAVNGVPIFNPFNNRREDTNLIGELDRWGGHSGRADDYHYHIAPVHLQKTVGKGNPVAYALDGYPIYGYTEPDGSKVKGLDWLNGHKDADGRYHYHASRTYPYLNGGFFGEVVERDGQVDPQPRAQPLRPSLTPLKGAKITGYSSSKPGNYRVELDVRGEKRSVDYAIADDGSVTYKFTDSSGTRTETHRPRTRDAGGRRGRDEDVRRRDTGGDPLHRALDANGDGTIDADELKKAAEIIRSLDRNDDGQISRDELRGSKDRQDGNRRPPGGRRQ